MSASASKKKRQAKDEQGLTSAQAAANKKLEEQKKKRLPTLIFILVAVVAVALIVVLALIGAKQAEARLDEQYAPGYDTSLVAATVGDETITVPIYNYFYNTTVNQNAQMYMYFYGLQMDVPFAEQTYGDGTFEDFFIEQANASIQQYLNIYAEAKANGYTLSQEDKDAIEESLKELRSTSANYGFKKTDYYLYNAIGPGCTEENYRDYLELTRTVSSYYEQKKADFEPTDEEIAAEYAANPAEYDVILYSVFNVNAEATEVEVESDDDNSETHTHNEYSDEALAKAKADAEAAEANFPEENVTSANGNKSTLENRYDEETVAWLTDPARQAGDVKMFAADEDGHSYRVLRYDSRDDNNYQRVNAYVVSIPKSDGSTDESGNAKPSSDKIVELIKAGMSEGMTDEAFEKLISDNGYTASSTEVAKRSYSDDITSFLFDDARQAGDYEIFVTDSTTYIVRYQSRAEQSYQYELVRDGMREAAETAWYDEVSTKYSIDINKDALAFAHTNLTMYSNSSNQ